MDIDDDPYPTWSRLRDEAPLYRNEDFHRLLRLWRTGRLDLEGMITRRIGLDGIDDAFEAMERGEGIRTLIEFP